MSIQPKYAIGEYVTVSETKDQCADMKDGDTGIIVEHAPMIEGTEQNYVVKNIEDDETWYFKESQLTAHDDQPGLRVTRDNLPEIRRVATDQVLINGELYELDGYGEELSNGSRWAVLRRVE